MKKYEVLSRVAGIVGEHFYEVLDWVHSEIKNKRVGMEIEIPLATSGGCPTYLHSVSFLFPRNCGGTRNIFGWDGSRDQFEIRFPPAPANIWFSDIMIRRVMRAVRLLVAIAGVQGFLIPWTANLEKCGERFPACGTHIHFSWALIRCFGLDEPRRIVDVVEPAVRRTKSWLGDRRDWSIYGSVREWRGQRHGIEVRGFESIYWSEEAVAALIWNVAECLWAYKHGEEPMLVDPSFPDEDWLNDREPFRTDVERMMRGRCLRLSDISLCRLAECGDAAVRLMRRVDPDVTLEYLEKIRPIVYVARRGGETVGVVLFDRQIGRAVVPVWLGSAEELVASIRAVPVRKAFVEVAVEDEAVCGLDEYGFALSNSTVLFFFG